MKKSDEVLMVHILRNSSQVSPSGSEPITMYQAAVLRRWKAAGVRDVVDFSVPMGMVRFDSGAQATTSIKGFKPLVNGSRYVVFLRFSRGRERDLTPARRLTGDGIQGAFKMANERIFPAYRLDTIGHKYVGMPTAQFLDELKSAAGVQAKRQQLLH